MDIWNVPSSRNFNGPKALLLLEFANLVGKTACSEGAMSQSTVAKAKKAIMILLSIAPRSRTENQRGLLIPTPSLARGLPRGL